ncbi:hypothetical protein KP509_33G003400 [Ceratopteris richardii]|uniref:NB-ARC domain-containing protein n=1 Tax=Ceratopteris richardii TaxID=49495 RepID=A0A8T2QNP6_CERRI|nr:hypothetical protein KP509_33G003400 [Ceratopteris richardii]
MEYKRLVERVMEIFKEANENSMDVTDFPVGLLQRHKEIESRIVSQMSNNHRSVQYFGLWGKGGVGKTTTAKSIFNGMHKEFESSAFFLDTRAEVNSSNSGFLHVQHKILDELKVKRIAISKTKNADDGKKLLSSKLKGVSAFIVLDNLDTRSQIDALCYPLSCLAADSIVIITSRDPQILTYASIPEENIFCIEGLSEENSEWLFCWHAFMNPMPPAHLKKVAKKAIKACQGLPLSLKVLGCHLFGANDINKWKETLRLIQQDEENIFDILKVSLNSLKLREKEAFLDICAFFIGREEDFVCAFIEDRYEMGTTILTALKSQCLITVKRSIKENPYDTRREVRTIQVHDQLRDIGRYIIQKEEKNRAWDEKTSNDILKDATALSGLRGLSARTDMQYPGKIASYNSSSQLIFLELEEAQEKAETNEGRTIYNLFATVHCDELRWLRWGLPEELPRGLCSEQLRVLLLSNSGIRELPDSLPNLRILEIEHCDYFEGFSTPIGTSMPLLRRLNFSRCPRLKSLDSSIGRLTDLRSLTIDSCASTMHLPKEITKLPSLRELTLQFLRKIKTLSLPPNLRTLRLWWCDRLERVDASLPSLEELKVYVCPKLKKLPLVGSCFVELTIEQCEGLVLDDDQCLKWKDLRSLRELTLIYLREMKTLSLHSNLRTLTLWMCDSLESVDASLPELEELTLKGCPNLKKLPILGSSLRRLTIEQCAGRVLDDDECLELKVLPSLPKLTLESSGRMKTLSLPQNLRTLRLQKCDRLENVDASLPNLEALHVRRCQKLTKLPVLGSALVRLEIRSCDGLVLDGDECFELKDLRSLRELTLIYLREMKTLSLHSNLRTLTLWMCDSLESVDASLPELEELTLKGCPNLKKLPILGSSLRRLTIEQCAGRVLDDDECLELKVLPSLPKLTLESSGRMKTLSLPQNLRTLRLQKCDRLENVDASLPNLEALHVRRCQKLTKLPVLGSALVRLEIRSCDGLVLDGDECFELKELPSLRELTLISGRIRAVSVPPNLRRLTLGASHSLESVDGPLPNLEELALSNCPKVKTLPVLGNWLIRLTIEQCVGLVLDDEDCLELKGLEVTIDV